MNRNKKLYSLLLDSFQTEELRARDMSDRDLLELIFFMLLERRELNSRPVRELPA